MLHTEVNKYGHGVSINSLLYQNYDIPNFYFIYVHPYPHPSDGMS